MNYLVIGREGGTCCGDESWENSISKVFSTDVELTKEELIEKFHKHVVLSFFEDGADETWTDDDFEQAYEEENGWNCVDTIFKSKKPFDLEEVE